ncbi:rRNA maturation RNase YbeY [Alicyclobacillus sp. ALC3]|uniref:rRNA maturation RNase YbeY n=1 Tax=Alicyclobacillus sp. ALC3 TaxID=2796143 RepID=UPI0023780072|nr:rRNA maturation RNase YbeY [Alicyclobacillus sp. ALC3]WDL96342.1 rRNA maturation RNase YbeY [Alicyclobacillus sp. ALC3]
MSAGLEVDVDVRVTDAPAEVTSGAFVARVLSAAATRINAVGEVSVSFVDDEEIHELNKAYRDVDRSTDVLSFPMDEQLSVDSPMLGDIVVSLPTAVRQAQEYGHSLAREVGFLLVHGFLHLNGYDHEEPSDEQTMFALQDEVLDGIGLAR